MLEQAELGGRIHGVRRALTISNLLFADDSLLFCRATRNEVEVIVDILQVYAKASSQSINFDKSSAYFNSNTQNDKMVEIMETLGVKEVERFESYLGLPTLFGRAKYQTFSFLRDRVWKKLQGWKGMLLSRAGKEVLIKAVAQSIPTYTMGVFQLPIKLCDELNSMCTRFWWGQVGNERKIHWRSWDKLTIAKKEGGMGFRDLRTFNLAMLAKQGWRLLQQKESLLYKCFLARYFPWSHFLDAVESPNCSYVWRSILAALPILKAGYCWRVGDGASIRIQVNKWIPNHPTNRVLYPANVDVGEWFVADLIEPDMKCWKQELIMATFRSEDVEAIC